MKPFAQLNRFFTAALLLLLSLAPHAGAVDSSSPAQPLIDLDAAALVPGELKGWPNAGTLGGEFVADISGAPIVSEVAGRRAVSFAADKVLGSSFKAPPQITGGKPFTLSLHAYIAQPAKRMVMASWASRPNGSAEFAYGPGPDGAFFGWDTRAKYANFPAPKAWHHIAYTFSGIEFCIYVDGVLDSRIPIKLAIKPNGRVYLGSGWDSVGGKPSYPFVGSLSRLTLWDRALTLRELRNNAGAFEAFDPVPADGSVVAAESTTLRWQSGHEKTAGYLLRLGTDQTMASADDSPARRIDKPELKPDTLSPGHTYYWRVDQIDPAGKLLARGVTWKFITDLGPATAPAPRNQVAGVPIDTRQLTWTPGRYATAQTLYFGTSQDAVASGAAPSRNLTATGNTLTLEKLEPGTTYYWRVQQDNGKLQSDKGETWSFRTADATVKDDVTFFVSSDTHYGLGNNDELNRKVIDEMNRLPGLAMPDKAGGGIVRTPRGVVLCGDLIDKGFEPKIAVPAWDQFCKDYGLTGRDGRLAYPVYEGFGNHDGMTGKSITRAGIKERNPKRVGLTQISSNGFHYSWDWDHVHCVQLNLFPGNDSADCIVGPPNHHPENALDFLKADLAKFVGDSGKLVIVFCHYCYSGGMADWWTQPAKDRFRDAVNGYRTLLVHGHSHGAYFYQWKGLRAISDGSTARPDSQTGDFLVVRLTRDNLYIAQRKLGEWGITLSEPLPKPATSAVVK